MQIAAFIDYPPKNTEERDSDKGVVNPEISPWKDYLERNEAMWERYDMG